MVFFNPRQPEIQTVDAEREPLVIDAQTVQYRRLNIVDVNGTFDDVETEFIGCT